MVYKTSNRLSTKFDSPIIRSLLVKRSRLVERLRLGMKRKLGLVIAPAGYGKTTLLGEWLASISKEDWPTAWLSLDDDDNNPLRFWGYVAEALTSVNPEWKIEVPKMGETSSDEINHQLFTSWINQIDNNPTHFSLILDDYHTIQLDSIHKDLAYIIAHMPQHMHLVVASRIKPKFPVAELLVKNQLVEINSEDLAFSASESEVFLREVMGLNLTSEEMAVLARSTEGWIAGLQMAALSIKNQPDASQWIKRFSSSHGYIFNYLTEAVLDVQDEPIQDFLLKTSILTELSAPLCDYVLDIKNSQDKLDYLESTNLFITPLSQERDWYRYHALFADVLKIRLERNYPQSISELHLRAATWLKDNDFAEEAIAHAVSSGNFELAANVMESCSVQMLGRADFINFIKWIGFLPDSLLRQRPLLWIYSATAENFLGNLDKAKSILQDVEQYLDEANKEAQLNNNQANLYKLLFAIQAVVELQSENYDTGISLAIKAMRDLTESDRYTYGSLNHFLGYAYETAGDLEAAIDSFARGVKFALNHHIPSGIISRCEIGRIRKIQGHLHMAEHEYRNALDFAVDTNLAIELVIYIQLGLADVLIERNDFELADQWAGEVERYLAEARFNQYGWLVIVELYTRLANFYLIRDLVKAKLFMQKVRRELKEAKPFYFFPTITDLRIRIWLAEGDFASAQRWVEKKLAVLENNVELSLAEQIGLARILLSQEKYDIAYPLLSEAEARARANGMGEKLLEALILKALALNIRGDSGKGIETLIEALTLAEPEGYVRIFINEGKLVQSLLSKTHSIIKGRSSSKNTPPTQTYIEKLIVAFDTSLQFSRFIDRSKPVKATTLSPLVEPLSERELDVLDLLRNGKSGSEIADILVLSKNTVKVHVRNIYQKLDAHNRKEALERAAEYNLLD
jgi:LuxR family maltose regulon positive regulatory protein